MGYRRHRAARTLHLEALEERTLLDGGLHFDPSGQNATAILVHFRPGTTAVPILPGTTIGDKLALVPDLYEVNLSPGVSLAAAVAAYQANPLVVSAEPDYAVAVNQIPNDPGFRLQNNLYNTGQYGGTVGADIHATGAWDVTTGNTRTVVAEMDTGIDYTHPDLYRNIWINQAEIPTSRLRNLRDVDGDGLITFVDLNNPINQGPGKIMPRPGNTTGIITGADILAPMQLDARGNDTGLGGWAHGSTQDGDTAHPDDLIGWNFVANNNNPMDDHEHGTEVAGIMTATGNNGIGVAGVAWQTQVMPVKFLNSHGRGDTGTFITAFNYAVAHGAKISNNSWGGAGNSPALYAAIQNARAAGHIFVVAAGNDTANLDFEPQYPPSFNLDNIVSVASTDRVDALAGYSNYGLSVAIAAPGENLYSTKPRGGYGYDSGTSMATPEVTGALDLVWGLHPNWTYAQVINKVLDTADRVLYLRGRVRSGRLNVAAAVALPLDTGSTYTSTAPKNLEYYGSAISSIAVGDSQTITNLQVQVNITHNHDSDLFIHLQAPDGAQIVLANRRGGSGANYQNTTFDDHASTAIGQAAAPFAGSFRPEGPLAGFNEKNSNGVWRLWVDDLVGNGNGAILSWSLTFNAGAVRTSSSQTTQSGSAGATDSSLYDVARALVQMEERGP